MDSDIDAEYVAELRAAGAFFWLDISDIPSVRLDELTAALGLDLTSRSISPTASNARASLRPMTASGG